MFKKQEGGGRPPSAEMLRSYLPLYVVLYSTISTGTAAVSHIRFHHLHSRESASEDDESSPECPASSLIIIGIPGIPGIPVRRIPGIPGIHSSR